MSRKKTLWFGTTEHREWVMCPDQGMQMNSVGFGTSGTFVNGGAWADSSVSKHREYNATFSGNVEDVQQVLDFTEGQFGPGPYYFVDPFAQYSNALSKWLASPRLMVQDAPSFTKTEQPILLNTPTNTLRLPTKSAVFDLPDAGGLRTFRFAIPSGFTANLKWWGSTTDTAALHANGTAVAVDMAETRTGDWLDLTLSGSGTITIAGIMCQFRPTGTDPDFSIFKSGRGTTAVAVTGTQLTGYSAIRGRVSATMDLLEVGGWEA